MSFPSRKTLGGHDPTYMWKLVLRITIILFAFISIIMLAWAINSTPLPHLTSDFTPYSWTYTNLTSRFARATLSWSFISLGLSLSWSITNIMVLFKRNGRYMHPGFNVAFDLLLWLGLIVTDFFAGLGGAFWVTGWIGVYNNQGPNEYSVTSEFANGTQTIDFPNGTSYTTDNYCFPFADCAAEKAYNEAFVTRGGVVLAAVVFTFFLILFHFALFISACRYTHQRNKAKSSQKYPMVLLSEARESTGYETASHAPMTGPPV